MSQHCPPTSSSSSSSSSSMSQHCPPNEPKEKSNLNKPHPSPLPELTNQKLQQELAHSDDCTILEGAISNIKLILKHLQEHKDSTKEDDGSKPQCLADILNILQDLRSGIELILSHRSGRRLYSGGLSPRSPKPRPSAAAATEDQNQKLRRELSASLTARKSLERMFSSLGREKEMIAGELARKVQELSCMEELVSDLRADNSKLAEKLRAWREAGSGGDGGMEMKEMKEKLLKVLEGYKMVKRRLGEAKEENERVRGEVKVVVERMRRKMREMEKDLEELAMVGLLPPCSN